MNDVVNHPEHYTSGGIESIEYMKASMSPEAFQGFCEGSAKKYIHRYRYKGKPIEDIEKAIWYLNRLKKELEDERSSSTTVGTFTSGRHPQRQGNLFTDNPLGCGGDAGLSDEG